MTPLFLTERIPDRSAFAVPVISPFGLIGAGSCSPYKIFLENEYVSYKVPPLHNCSDMIFRHIFLIGNHISFNRSAVYKKGFDAFLRFGRIINVNMINGTAEMPRYGKSGQVSGIHGSMQSPSNSGRIPRIYCETFVNVHAAVPVSQLFFASPKRHASFPAIICE